MHSRDDYTVGWVCALAVEVAAAKAILDHVHPESPAHLTLDDNNCYIFGSLNGHNVVLGYPSSSGYGTTSAAAVASQMAASFGSIRFSLMIGIGGGVPSTKEDVFLGDVVVGKPTAARPAHIQYDVGEDSATDRFTSCDALNQPSTLLLMAACKAETNDVIGDSPMPHYVSDIVHKDTSVFSRPSPEQDVLFDTDYDHATTEDPESGCNHCHRDRIHHRPRRQSKHPKVHYGLVASSKGTIYHGVTRDKYARKHGILCFETEAAGLVNSTQYLIIRGICDYADSHRSNVWHGYAAAAAAAYAKEIMLLIAAAPKSVSKGAETYATAAPLLDALLLTRPDVDRSSLIALKGRRVHGTCEWLLGHSSYQEWLVNTDPALLWISGGPGKGKTMLAIYITEVLQPVIESTEDVLLYYFCSNRDKNRNTAITVMRGIIHQWLAIRPHLAQYIKNYFDGTETTKYTVSSFPNLWRLFQTLLDNCGSCQVLCVLDGLDECNKESLEQLLDAVGECLSRSEVTRRSNLKLIVLSRPQPVVLESKLGQYYRIRLDDADMEIGKDVERYVFAKVNELASEQSLSEDMLLEVRRALMAGADGTFLWVGFVANELKGRSWSKMKDILRLVPKGLGGVYRRLLQQIEDKQQLVLILQWIVLAARPLTMDELALAAEIKTLKGLSPREVLSDRLSRCGLLVKVDGDVVNLVHESAKEFFQSEQIKVEGISMFHMNQFTHRTLLRTCLALIESSHQPAGNISDASLHSSLLSYASRYWPEHFRHAFDAMDAESDFSRPIFRADSRVRNDWWEVYWDQEKYGGASPSFTLLHLAAYFGNLGWIHMLLKKDASKHIFSHGLTSRKDNYGRTPLFWAAVQGHRDVVDLLLDHGARVNSKDRSKLTALHIAVSGEHKDVVSLLLDRSARIEGKASYGDTPLIRAIQSNSAELVKLLLERGASVDGLPTPPEVVSLKGPECPLDERVEELLGLQEQLFAARYESSSRLVEVMISILTLSFRFPPIVSLVKLYLQYSSIARWDVMHVLQDLVKNNRTDRLRKWAKAYREFGVGLVMARNAKNLEVMTGLSVLVFQVVSTADLEALLVIGVLVGSSVILAAAQQEWREGVTIAARTFAQFACLAYHRDAGEYLHYGVREFLADFDDCIRSNRRAENVSRTTVLFSTHFAILATKDARPIAYFSTVIAEYYEGHTGGRYEEVLFDDANRACANELSAISEIHDTTKLHLFLTALLQFADCSRESGQVRFINMLPAACLILCQRDPHIHRWLITEAIPETMSALISQQQQGPAQTRAYKALVECLIIGKHYGLFLLKALRQTMEKYLDPVDGAGVMLDQILHS